MSDMTLDHYLKVVTAILQSNIISFFLKVLYSRPISEHVTPNIWQVLYTVSLKEEQQRLDSKGGTGWEAMGANP